MNLAVLGINFKSAPLEIREKASLNAQGVRAALDRLSSAFPGSELVLLSTCNRTELYLSDVDAEAHKADLVRALTKSAGTDSAGGIEQHFYVKADLDAARHLLAVASSLDSMVVGETEILGQVKQAFAQAAGVRAPGRCLSPVFEHAFRCAKRVHTETDVCRGRVSVSSLAVEFAEKVFEDLRSKTVMIVGAGETAELALRSLVERGVHDVLVLNRSLDRGQALADRHGGRAIPFELLDDYLSHADIVISSTSAPHVVIQVASVRRAMAARRGKPVLLIDIAVPRNIDAAVGELKDAYLYHIDDLQRLAAENLARRQEGVQKAWRIVDEVAAELVDVFKVRGVGTIMQRLDDHGRAVWESVLTRGLAREEMAALPEPCKAEIRTLAQRIVNKMLAAPREALRQAARNGQWEEYAKVATHLFGLDRAARDEADGNENRSSSAQARDRENRANEA
jgi:glutamyl-tRNA reductase